MNPSVFARVPNYTAREPRIRGLLFHADVLEIGPRWDRAWHGSRHRPANFTVCGARFRLIQYRNKTEIYQVAPDGVEHFVDYEIGMIREVVGTLSADLGEHRSLGVA